MSSKRRKAKILKRELIENALTLVRNNEFLIPFQNLEEQKIASLSIGASSTTPFQKRLSSYTDVKHFNAAKDLSSYKQQDLLNQLSKYKTVIVGIHDMNSSARKGFGVTVKTKNFLQDLKARTKVVLVVFGNPYSLKYFDSFDHLVEAYDDNEITQDATAQGLFGAFSFRGKLPVTASPSAKFNDGITTPKLFRMGYSLPESVGLDSRVLTRIDALAIDAVQTKSTPGCVVLVAKDGKVVYEKAFGHHTYSKKRRMKTDDIFDLASITKVAASTVSTMKLHEQGKINIYNKMSQYLPDLVNTNKKDIAVHDMMTHHAALHPWIPFFEQPFLQKNILFLNIIAKTPKEGFSKKVTEKLYMKDDFVNEMWQQIYDSELRPNKEYKYSDLGFFMVGDMVGKVSGKPLEKYAAENFYKPLGLSTTTFNPWKEHEISRIVPSEDDKYWRRQKVQGYVHDMGAAMLGGVSGHAGLFSSANDLAILMQMILNGGYYGGERFLDSETIQTFTNRCPDCTRRGIGFDMLQTNKNLSQNLSQKASLSTYGHLGFTGTCTWVDPENNIVYVFLSNRTYPSMKNYKLSEKDYRPNIQSIIYDALIK